MKAFIYFNLHSKLWSIKALAGPCNNRVIVHADRVLIVNAEFKVSEAGRQRVIQEKRKNVHAGVVGTVLWFSGTYRPDYVDKGLPEAYRTLTDDIKDHIDHVLIYGDPVTYNPYKHDSFMVKQTSAIHDADKVYMAAGSRRVLAL